jgi:prepilin-type processing-associated H-X9-DG protein
MMKLDNSWLWIKSTRDKSDYAWGFLGDSFVFYLGEGADKFLPTLAAPPADASKALAANPAFSGSLAKLPDAGGDAILTTYVDAKRFVGLLHQFIRESNNGDVAALDATWMKFVALAGVDNLIAQVERTTVHDNRFVTQSLLRTDGPPHGLMASLVEPPVDQAMLKLVPPDAMFAVALRMDLAKAYDGLKAGVIAVAGEDGQKTFGEIEDAAAGFGIPVTNLFGPLGDQWVLYEAASTGGFFFTGLTLVVDLKDEAKLSRTITALKALLARQAGADGRAPIAEYDADGVSVHYVQPTGEFAPFSPAWVVTDKKLFIALYPQVVEDAVRQLKADKSLLDNPEFTAAYKQTGGGGPLVYLSNSEFTKSLYPITLPLVSALRDLGVMEGGDVNAITIELLPSLQRLLTYVGDDVVSMKLTADGILRIKSVANPLLTPLTLFDSVPLWVAAALPTLATSAESVDRARSASNLRSIGQNVQLHVVDNNGTLPPDLKVLTADGRMDKQILHSPFGEPGSPSDYRYLVAGVKSPVPPDVLIAFDSAEFEKGDGANVLYGDGHVEWLDRDAVNAALEKTNKWRQEQKAK